MGLLYHDVRELLLARQAGVDFSCTATIGRQQLFLHAAEYRQLAREFAIPYRRVAFGDFADDFLRDALGVKDLQPIDASDYGGAAIIHDHDRAPSRMAASIGGPRLRRRFSTRNRDFDRPRP